MRKLLCLWACASLLSACTQRPDRKPVEKDPACTAFLQALQDSLAARGLAAQFDLQGSVMQFNELDDVGCLAQLDIQVLTVAQMAQQQTVKPDFIVRRFHFEPTGRAPREDLHIVDFDTGAALVILIDPETRTIRAVGVEQGRAPS